MSKRGELLGRLLNTEWSGEAIADFLEPLSGKTVEEKERLAVQLMQKLEEELASAPSAPTQTDD